MLFLLFVKSIVEYTKEKIFDLNGDYFKLKGKMGNEEYKLSVSR